MGTWAQAKAKLKKAKVRSESSIQLAVCEHARKLGWRVTKRSHANAFGANGEPDYEFMTCGKIFYIEFKKPGAGQTEKQEAMASEIIQLGYSVYVIDDAEAGRKIINSQSRGLKLLDTKWKSVYRKRKEKGSKT